MKIASWNVNSIKARKDHVLKYLQDTDLDVLMVQELKGTDFPAEDFKAIGYETAAVTQKAYNGVAVFSKTPIGLILDHLPGDPSDEQARYIEFETNGIRLINIYLPNGNPVFSDSSSRPKARSAEVEGSDQTAGIEDPSTTPKGSARDDNFHEKFSYKLAWMDRLYQRFKTLRDGNTPFVIGGDFNVIPTDSDCHDPKAWKDDALAQPQTRAAFQKLTNTGLYDTFRIFNKTPNQYTFWDYQAGAWQKDNGIRIDHFLASPEITDRLISCTIDRTPRGWDKPSDHTPIIINIAA
ncbi:MAG: exodeoxyribonuclease III [Bdellovibrionales bacterium]